MKKVHLFLLFTIFSVFTYASDGNKGTKALAEAGSKVKKSKTVNTAADLAAAINASYGTVFIESETDLDIKKATLPTRGTLRIVGVPRKDGSKPVIKIELTVPSNTETDRLSLIFENLVLDHSYTPNLGGTASKYHFSYKDSASHYADTIAFRNCEIRNVVRGFYRAQNLEVAGGGYNDAGCIKNFEVTGCTFHQIPQNNLFALFYMGQRVNHMTFRNNVFYDIPGLKGIVQFAYMDDNSGREDIVFTFENNDVIAHPSQHLFLFDSFVGQMSEFHINNNFFLTPDWKDDYNNYYIDTDSIARLKDASIARIQYGVYIDIHNNVLYKYKAAEDARDEYRHPTWLEGCYEEVDFCMEDVGMTWNTFGDAHNDDFSYINTEFVTTAGVDGVPIGSTDLVKYLQNPISFTATANVEKGSVSPAKGTYEQGETVTVTAIEQPGVSFVEWRTTDGTFVSNENPYTFVLSSSLHLVANFDIDNEESADEFIEWNIDTISGMLKISGTGEIPSYDCVPWYEKRAYIRTVYIDDGITSVGHYAFANCSNLAAIYIPKSMTSFENSAFSGSSPSIVVNLSECDIEVPITCKEYTFGTLIDLAKSSFVYSDSTPIPEFTRGSAPFTISLLEAPSLEKNVGTYTANCKFRFSVDDLKFDATIPYTYTITPAPATVNVTSTSREYGEANPEFDYTVSGLFGSDAIDVTITAPDYRSKAGSYSFTASTTAKNYSIASTTGALTITKAPLTVTADNYTKTYGNANPKFTVHYQGFKNGESTSVFTVIPTISSQATVSSPVGEYAITASGGAAQNYEFQYVPGTLTITKAPLTIAANNASRLYFEDTHEFSFRSEGWKNNEDASVLTAQPTMQCAAEKTSPAGVYDIVPSGAEAQNYAISYENGSLTIDKRTLTVTAKDAERCYGEENPEFECSFGGFVNDETADVLTTMPEAITTAEQWSDVGTYSIVMQGGEATNYAFDYVAGTLSILKTQQRIEWEQELSTATVGSQILLTATATSGLEVTYKYDDSMVEVYSSFDGMVLDCFKEGTVTIRATQDGNQNYHPADRVSKTLNIVSTGVTPLVQEDDAAIYDLQGRKVLEAVKGFYIQNGKKVYRE